MTKLVNGLLRRGLDAARRNKKTRKYREKTFAMGEPRIDLTKALAVAAVIEDTEIVEKLSRRK
ncbi:MAG: hypothetical protein WD278_18225 [Pirellulales bacterium]